MGVDYLYKHISIKLNKSNVTAYPKYNYLLMWLFLIKRFLGFIISVAFLNA